MWSSRDRRSYQVIDDDYEDTYSRDSREQVTSFSNPRSNLFRAPGTENEPLITTSNRDNFAALNQTMDQPSNVHAPPSMITSRPEASNRSWDHIKNLDEFFSLVYEYHQGSGYSCICWKKICNLLMFVFLMVFCVFFLQCVDYDLLFANKNTTSTGAVITGKRHINDIVIGDCPSQLNWVIIVCILLATAFWISRLIKSVNYLIKMRDIQIFYTTELTILDAELSDYTWDQIVNNICKVQPRLQLMITNEKLTSDYIYNRILRFKNYFIALVNRRVLPPVFNLPFIGETAYFPNLLKDLMKRIIFFSSSSPWHGPCLKDEYRSGMNPEALTRQMEQNVTIYAAFFFFAMPFTFLYQIARTFMMIAELWKKNPETLGNRRYSNFGRYRVRHFNELNHELSARLNRSHCFANAYMSQFYSPLLKVIASNIRVAAGAIVAAFALLTVWDEDVLQVEHIITVMAVGSTIFVVCSSMIPDENLVWEPEALLTHVVSELPCMPQDWLGKAHTAHVRKEFEEFFQIIWMFVLHELTAPIFAPFILFFWLRPRCRDIIEFLQTYTVRIESLGDVCSFALMDVALHGDRTWNGKVEPDNVKNRALDGKTEISALHFASKNRNWRPPQETEHFLRTYNDRLSEDAAKALAPSAPERNMLLESVHYLTLNTGRHRMRGDGVHRIDGPLVGRSILPPLNPNSDAITDSLRRSGVDVDSLGADMRVKTMYLSQLHRNNVTESLCQNTVMSSYDEQGTMSMAPNHSVFEVPQTLEGNNSTASMMGGSVAPSRYVNRRPQEPRVDDIAEGEEGTAFSAHESDEEDESDDDRPPLSFGTGGESFF